MSDERMQGGQGIAINSYVLYIEFKEGINQIRKKKEKH
jgi:hypothetical protein